MLKANTRANPFRRFHHSSAQGKSFHPRSFFHGQVFERCESLMFPRWVSHLQGLPVLTRNNHNNNHHLLGVLKLPPTSPKKVINFCSATSEVGQMPGIEKLSTSNSHIWTSRSTYHITNIINHKSGFRSWVKKCQKPRSNKKQRHLSGGSWYKLNRSGPFLLQITKIVQKCGTQ